MGEGQEIVLYINAWLFAGICISGLGIAVYVIYILLAKLAQMVIDGIQTDIHSCQTELMTEINAAFVKAESAHQHAENAHTRVGRMESVLMQKGVDQLEKK